MDTPIFPRHLRSLPCILLLSSLTAMLWATPHNAPAAEPSSWIKTDEALDVAIDGPGWFILLDPITAQNAFTRYGSFRADLQGYLVNIEGFRLQGFRPDGSLEAIRPQPFQPPPTTDPLAIVTNVFWTATGQIQVRWNDGTESVSAQIALQNLVHPERLDPFGFKTYWSVEPAEPLSAPVMPGSAGVGTLISSALNSEPEILRLRVLEGTGLQAQGTILRVIPSTHLAIRGPGVFKVRNPQSGVTELTRAGLFLIDRDGYLITYDRWRVQGWSSSDLTMEGDIQINGDGRPLTSDPTAVMVSYFIDREGRVVVRLSEGTEYVRGQVLPYRPLGPLSVKPSSLGRYTSSKSIMRLPLNPYWIEASAVEPIHVTPQLAAMSQGFYFEWQGLLTRTSVPTDLAIAGLGWFLLRNPITEERSVTRNGHFKLDPQGFLITPSGLRVQGLNEPSLQQFGDIKISDDLRPPQIDPGSSLSEFSIDHDGMIRVRLANGTEYVRAQILFQRFKEPFNLKESSIPGIYTNLEASVPTEPSTPAREGNGLIEAGALEIPPPPFEGIPSFHAEGIRLRLTGDSETPVPIEFSDDLQTWKPLGAVTVTEGLGRLNDTSSPTPFRRFYRIAP